MKISNDYFTNKITIDFAYQDLIIDIKHRNIGLGSYLFSLMLKESRAYKNYQFKSFSLSRVDAKTPELRESRNNFYRRNGCKVNDDEFGDGKAVLSKDFEPQSIDFIERFDFEDLRDKLLREREDYLKQLHQNISIQGGSPIADNDPSHAEIAKLLKDKSDCLIQIGKQESNHILNEEGTKYKNDFFIKKALVFSLIFIVFILFVWKLV